MVTQQPGAGQRSTRRRTTASPKPKADVATVTAGRDHAPGLRWAVLSVPVPVAVRLPALRLPVPHLSMPGPGLPTAIERAARSAAGVVATAGASLPAPRRLAYYGTLGVMAAVGALEWPVAAAIGVGVWVAGRPPREAEPPGREVAAGPDGDAPAVRAS